MMSNDAEDHPVLITEDEAVTEYGLSLAALDTLIIRGYYFPKVGHKSRTEGEPLYLLDDISEV